MRYIGFILFLMLGLSTSSYALGPIDGEVTLNWWVNQRSNEAFSSNYDADTLNLRADNWWDEKWGLRGGIDFTDVDSVNLGDSRRYNIDVQRRLISFTDNTYIAAGLGWENIRLANGDSTNGLRLSLGGSLGLGGVASLYGESIWMPSLASTNKFSDVNGLEIETGVMFNPLPFISVRAGYRRFKLDYSLMGGQSDTISQGIIIGTGIHW